MTTDWSGNLYCGITLDWNYTQGTVDLSMPGYIKKALSCFEHPIPTKPHHAPSAWTKPQYGTKLQLPPAENISRKLDPKEEK
jgi:hypothetical protein